MKTLKNIKQNKYIVFTLTSLIIAIMLCFCTFECIVNAEEVNQNLKFEKLDLQKELESIEGFDFSKYQYDITARTPQIINIVEYCYSFIANKRSNYGLYLYIYNPQNITFDQNNNKATLAVDFNEKGDPIQFEKFDLKLISKIETGAYANLFYKFKIIDHVSKYDNKKIVDRVNTNNRLYYISELELKNIDNQTADCINVGTKYSFTGYAKGYGANEEDESTLSWQSNNFETIEISGEDIGHSNIIRNEINMNGYGHHDQIFSVYFSVPNDILKNYGNLQKVKFETYEYKTAPIIVTKNNELYNKLLNHRNALITSSSGFQLATSINLKTNPTVPETYEYRAKWGVNFDSKAFGMDNTNTTIIASKSSNHLPYVFFKDFGDNTTDIKSNDLLKYIYGYNSSNFKGYLNNRNITKDLFNDSPFFINDGRKQGYFVKEIDAGDVQNLTGVSIETGWDKFWNDLFGKKPTNFSFNPIEKINDNYNFNSLLLNELDKTEFEQKMSIAKDKKRTMHTFRFAVTDFYSELLNVNSYINNNASQSAYVAETTAFLDFDIIQLTFNKNGEMTVIPVAMAPIDIVGNVNSPDIPNNNWWEKILQYIMLVLGIILIVLLVIVCWPIISLLIKAVCAIIALPFKAIGSLFKGSKKDKQTVNVVVSSAPTTTSGKTKKRKVSQNEIELAKKRFNKKE